MQEQEQKIKLLFLLLFLRLYEELEQAESGVDTQQQDALPALQLLSGQSRNSQQKHDAEHNGNVQHKGRIVPQQQFTHRHLEGSQRNSHAGN